MNVVPLPGTAVDGYGAAVALHGSVYDRQTSRSRPRRLGRKERIEDACQSRAVHAATVVGHRQTQIAASCRSAEAAGRLAIQGRSGEAELDPPLLPMLWAALVPR